MLKSDAVAVNGMPAEVAFLQQHQQEAGPKASSIDCMAPAHSETKSLEECDASSPLQYTQNDFLKFSHTGQTGAQEQSSTRLTTAPFAGGSAAQTSSTNHASMQRQKTEDSEESCANALTVRFLQLRQILQQPGSPTQVIIKSRPKKHLVQTQRGSKYRGVSKNGKKWQVSGITES